MSSIQRLERAVSQSDWGHANHIVGLLRGRASAQGEAAERVAFYFTEALASRISRATGGPEVPPADLPSSEEIQSAYLALNQVTPFIRFAHLTANQAMLEALEGENSVHIVDFDITQGVQWPPLMQALAERPEGPPHLRLTGIGRDGTILEQTGVRLAEFARSLQLPFMFHSVIIQSLESLEPQMLGMRTGEALSVNCMLQLHRLLEQGTEPLESLLNMVYTLSPKVVTLAEREANHNQSFFLDRFADAFHHYSTLFDSLEATLPPRSPERVNVEQLWFGREIGNIVACEGAERVERHQRFDEWRSFMEATGFGCVPPSTFALAQAKLLLRLHYPSEGYRLEDVDGCLLLGWQGSPLFAVSSWQTV